MQTDKWRLSKFLLNKKFKFNREYILKYLPSNLLSDSYKNISKWRGYNSTPLLKLNKLNKKLNLKNIFYKDESKRFHLKSFKALGGAYAVEKVSKKEKKNNSFISNCWKSWKICSLGSKKIKIKM